MSSFYRKWKQRKWGREADQWTKEGNGLAGGFYLLEDTVRCINWWIQYERRSYGNSEGVEGVSRSDRIGKYVVTLVAD